MERIFVNLTNYALRFAGAAAAIWGIAYAINGATQARGYITIRVAPTTEVADHLRVSGVKLPAGAVLGEGELSLSMWDSTVTEQVLSRADVLLSGLCAGVAALLVSGLLKTFMNQQPFTRGNAARIAWLAALVLVSGLAGPMLSRLAAATVLDRAELAAIFIPSLSLSWVPVAGCVFLLALALAFRRGAQTSGAVLENAG
ncbi:hypothetical protein [Nonomuraea helvata]|uniref:DUF2975 domain-containing protein n=1 Tax=Nonomuraea helvata TaxID=37484 RepID=A0ABV5S1G2_9ACTN